MHVYLPFVWNFASGIFVQWSVNTYGLFLFDRG